MNAFVHSFGRFGVRSGRTPERLQKGETRP